MNIFKLLIIAAAGLLAATAHAANAPYYAGVEVGNGFGVFGGAQVEKNIAVEVDYISYGNHYGYTNCGFANCGNYVTASRLGFFGVGSVPLNVKGVSSLSAFGKLGVEIVTVTASSGGTSYSASNIGLGAGIGAQYDFNKSVAARLGFDFNTYYSDDLYIGALVRF